MFWRFLKQSGSLSPGEVARRVHSLWLTRAFESGRVYPRIPTRRVEDGGFDRMMATEHGRARAERWWELALARMEDEE
jgi:hypothetical protein